MVKLAGLLLVLFVASPVLAKPHKTTMQDSGPSSWDEIPSLTIIAHRGSGNITAPENTMAAYNWAANYGYPIEGDFQYTADGHLVAIHDATIDRYTGVTGSVTVASQTLAQLKALDFSQGYIPALFSPQRVVTFGEYLRLGQDNLLIPEVKINSTEAATDMANQIVAAGLQDKVVIQSSNAPVLAAIKAVDPRIRTMRLGTVSVADATAAGYWGVGPEQSTVTQEYVTGMKAAGIKVFPYTVNYLEQAENLLALGVDGYFSDDALHISKAGYRIPSGTTTTLKVPEVYQLSGWRWASAKTGAYPVVSGGFATFAGYEGFTASQNFKLTVAGLRTADSPSTQTITTTVKIIAPPPNGDASRYLAVYFGWKTEFDGVGFAGGTIYNSNGYYFVLRMNGGIELVRVDNAAYTVLKTATWSTLTVGEEVPLQIDLTDTTITVTRTDTGQTITATDSTHSRGGFVRILGSGVVPAIGDVTITY